MQTWKRLTAAAAALVLIIPAPLLAQVSDTARDTGVSGIWVLANISFAGMRAQAHPSVVWRTVAFLLGLPGTLVSVLVVREGGGRAYGVELPRLSSGAQPEPAELRLEVRRK